MARTARPFLDRRAALEVSRLSPDLDPDEVVQETLLNLYRYGRGFRPEVPYAFSTWVGRILRNVVLRMLRVRRRQQLVSLQDLTGLEIEECASRGPVRMVLDEEERVRLGRDLGLLLQLCYRSYEGLTELQRSVLDRVAGLGHSYKEIAAELGMRVEAVKMVAFRARRRLSSDMERVAG
ncbi:MAG: RNA polymerase sigma factor [Planctomycetota bacterium]